ncbi:MAG: GNAT family N-acetyltransferase [Candidatus Bipolaricaulota bacterium]|nr:GNAT family N-acetyltransferase [Candidatus Bipolaricaulota bacterium]
MAESRIPIRAFDPATASRREMSAVHAFSTRMRAEAWPDDPPQALEDWERKIRTIPPYWTVQRWVAWRGEEAVAAASAYFYNTPHNRHIADADIGVLPEQRRRGIGKELLTRIVAAAEKGGKTLLIFGTDSALPAGRAFAERVGARPGMVSATNQLDLAHLDRALMARWRNEGPRDLFTLGWWIGPYPEEELEAICRLKDVMNTAPRDELQMEDWTWTPEMVRQGEAALAERRRERWTLYARHRPSGELAGFTEVFWDPAQKETLWQGDTGVLPKYRGRGLGKWLKATMIEKVLAERPCVVRVRTGNANSNAPMLAINRAMGFRMYKEWTIWQMEVAQARSYLAAG